MKTILCSECMMEMDYEYRTTLPGTNDSGYIIVPCCAPEETEGTLEYIKDNIADELREANDKLQDAYDALQLAIALKDIEKTEKAQQEVKDWQTSITSTIDELFSQFKE